MLTLKLGSKGNDVKTLLRRLNLIVDGTFGTITEEAVKQFLKLNGLLADGIVGPSTWTKLGFAGRSINTIILHCSATPEGKDYSVSTIRQWHLQRGFGDIGYHYVIYRDGTIATGRNIDKVGAHCTGHNTGSIGICYVGGLDKDGKTPKDTRTDALKKSLIKLVIELMETYGIPKSNIFGHYLFAQKACPSFKIETFKSELSKYGK